MYYYLSRILVNITLYQIIVDMTTANHYLNYYVGSDARFLLRLMWK